MRMRQNVSALPDKKGIDEAVYSDSVTKNGSNPDASWGRVFYICLAVRIVNSLVVQTYFNPDEHWQSLEVAHSLVFGYGHLTWEWERGIRSYLHPLLFAVLYKVIAFLHLDTPWLMMKAPRLLQSIFAAVCDLYLYKFSDVVFGKRIAQWTLFSQLTNWFVFFCCTRTLSNSLETVLTIVSLYYWPCMRVSSAKIPSSSRKWALAYAALACAVRPTSAVVWLYVGLFELLTASDKLKFTFLEAAPIGSHEDQSNEIEYCPLSCFKANDVLFKRFWQPWHYWQLYYSLSRELQPEVAQHPSRLTNWVMIECFLGPNH